ncbi:hypothetical protein FQN51_005507 [Onygenales sp. PD_10]|nr:hypothetical protein FQN51_005507 [Onygenales sp. PD_10]
MDAKHEERERAQAKQERAALFANKISQMRYAQVDPVRCLLPGLNLPLDYAPEPRVGDAGGPGGGLYPTALHMDDIKYGYSMLPFITLREITMLQIMNGVTDKDKWEKKVFSDHIVDRWREEAKSSSHVSEAMMEWIIEELRYKAGIFKSTGLVVVYNGDVVKSDVAVSQSTKSSLQAAVQLLEESMSSRRTKDFHPGSDEKVVDLVHPSMFPLVYGRSRVVSDETIWIDDCLSKMGEGQPIPVPPLPKLPPLSEIPSGMVQTYTPSWRWPTRTIAKPYSNKFQWLPCDVSLASGVKITSYINNLHPQKHRDIYDAVEDIIAAAIPLWSTTLARLDNRYKHAFNYWRISHSVPDTPFSRDPVLPEPGLFRPPTKHYTFDHSPLNMWSDHENLQVIVKLANIELTPEKPTYNGGTWHVEGQMNEHICATALYYYSNTNITPSTLSFRQGTFIDFPHLGPGHEHSWLQGVYGCSQYGPQVQPVGSVLCKEGRLLTFPNILQHKVEPFALADRSKPGHRKILALFLVDPTVRVLSTANVPPQQVEWWREEILARGVLGGRLPVELQEMVLDEVVGDGNGDGQGGFPMTMDEARGFRGELMAERSNFVEDQTGAFMSCTFNLCEH